MDDAKALCDDAPLCDWEYDRRTRCLACARCGKRVDEAEMVAKAPRTLARVASMLFEATPGNTVLRVTAQPRPWSAPPVGAPREEDLWARPRAEDNNEAARKRLDARLGISEPDTSFLD